MTFSKRLESLQRYIKILNMSKILQIYRGDIGIGCRKFVGFTAICGNMKIMMSFFILTSSGV